MTALQNFYCIVPHLGLNFLAKSPIRKDWDCWRYTIHSKAYTCDFITIKSSTVPGHVNGLSHMNECKYALKVKLVAAVARGPGRNFYQIVHFIYNTMNAKFGRIYSTKVQFSNLQCITSGTVNSEEVSSDTTAARCTLGELQSAKGCMCTVQGMITPKAFQ